jgi:acyl-CoA synthetase (AMP-forming)/AMP-acid ligase II
MAVSIVDARTGAPCPDGEVGEIVISGPSVGARVSQWPCIEAVKVVKTGDLGFLDRGELYVTGRTTELIIVRGGNVFPQDIEQAVLSCDDAIVPGGIAAFGVAAEGTQGIVVAFEVSRLPRNSRKLQATISETIGAQTGHVPHAVIPLALGRLPRTTSGKLQRRLIARMYAAGELAPLASTGEENPANA